VEVPPSKHPPPPTAFTEHSEEHDNEVSAHKVVHATTLAVEPLLNDAAPGAYHPPSPPIHDMAQTPQADPIGIRSDENNKGALALIITNTVKPSNNGLRGAMGAAAAATPPPLPPPTPDKPPAPTATTFPSTHDTLHDNGLDARGVAHTDTPTLAIKQLIYKESFCTYNDTINPSVSYTIQSTKFFP
jgi:hypothetical protein